MYIRNDLHTFGYLCEVRIEDVTHRIFTWPRGAGLQEEPHAVSPRGNIKLAQKRTGVAKSELLYN